MAVMSIIFGLVLTINLWFQGVENAYSELANQVTDGKVIIEATNSTEGMVIDDTSPQITRQEIIEDIEAHGGKVLGDTKKFGLFGSVVLPKELVTNNIVTSLENVPRDAAPVLVSTFLGEQLLGKSFPTEYADAAQKQKDYEEYRDKLIGKTFTDAYGAKYYVVGLNSGNFHVQNLSFRQLERGNSNLLNPILELITTPNGAPIIIDNGEAEHWQSGEEALLDGMVEAMSESLIAVFDDSKSAYDYFQHGKGRFMNVDLPNRAYSVNLAAGMSPEVMYVIRSLRLIANIVAIILILIAAIVVVFTSIRLVDQDQQNIALYCSLGATTKQVRMIYWCYFLELMIGAAILAFGLASAIVLIFNRLNHELIGVQSTLGFNLATMANEVWYTVNGGTFIIIVIMLIMSFMCIVINHKRLANVSFENV